MFIFSKVILALIMQIIRTFCNVACACCLKSEKEKEREKSNKRKNKAGAGKDSYSMNIYGDLRIAPLSDLYDRSLREL